MCHSNSFRKLWNSLNQNSAVEIRDFCLHDSRKLLLNVGDICQGEVGYFYHNSIAISTFPAGLEDYIYFGLEDYTNLFCYKINENKS